MIAGADAVTDNTSDIITTAFAANITHVEYGQHFSCHILQQVSMLQALLLLLLLLPIMQMTILFKMILAALPVLPKQTLLARRNGCKLRRTKRRASTSPAGAVGSSTPSLPQWR
jgi:hypothetical protein